MSEILETKLFTILFMQFLLVDEREGGEVGEEIR